MSKEAIVTIYTSKDCCLCEEAKKIIKDTKKDRSFSIREIDIATDKENMDRFKEEVPVIFINERKAFKYRVDKERLIERLDRV
ncbi:MAG: glutaredoxin family protein [Thermodesulfobacteriota bacterium]